MAEKIYVGGFKVEGDIVRTPDGCYESNIGLTYKMNPAELASSLAAGRQVFNDLIHHVNGCQSIGDAIAKLMNMNGITFMFENLAPAANDNPAQAAETPPTGGENGAEGSQS